MNVVEPPRIELASLPTPLTRLERLAAELARAAGRPHPALWIKRDDLTGLELSGNKVRKLEFIAADAVARGCDTLVTEGTPQSNHCRATAAVCARLGMHAFLCLRPSPAGPAQGNHLLDELFGAQTRFFERADLNANRTAIYESVCDELRRAGRRPRVTPMGASEPLGCWGYIRAFGELCRQLRAAGVGSADVVFAISSGGTAAGLALGRLLLAASEYRLLAVPVSDDVAWHRAHLTDLCARTIAQFGLPLDASPGALAGVVDYLDGYVGDGYAIPYPAVFDAIRRLARTEAIVLDPVYTGKAFWALLDGVARGTLGRDRPVVFLHTGGIFSNFAWSAELLAGAAN